MPVWLLSLFRPLHKGWKWFLDALLPAYCLQCHREGDWLCSTHYKLPPAPANQAIFTYLDKITAFVAYHQGVTAKLVTRFKFFRCRVLASLMAEYMTKAIPDDAILVPIPLHYRRSWWRGFNQSKLLAEAIVAIKPQATIITGLKRIRYTTQQAKLNKADRQHNLVNAFAWNSASPAPEKVILIDDVVASGATLDEAAKILKKNGSKAVHAVVFARGGN